ncbi:MAG: hypothetical protein Q4F17_05110 [Eubacteriales bacterium]|nr:hypothetical protein [Eubacteriales bacterium]
MKKLISFLLALTVVLSLSLTAYADEIGQVVYSKKAFSFLPGFDQGSLSYPDDLFPELKNVMPGDVLHQQVKITHKAGRGINIRVYIKAEGSDLNPEFIRQMNLQVEHKGGDILYEGDDYNAAEKSGWIKLATLAPGKSTTLDLTLTVPIDMGNEFADTLGTVVWKFKVEEVPIDPTNAKTGDTSAIAAWTAVLTLSAAALAVLLIRKRRKAS